MIQAVRHEPGRRKAIVLAVAVHLLLAAALFIGVRWKNDAGEAVQVELWQPPAAVAPPPPPPPPVTPEPKPAPKPEIKPEPPPPPKPDIAVKKVEPKKPEPKPQPKPEPKPAPKPDPKPAPQKPNFDDLLAREDAQLDRQKQLAQERDRAAREAQLLAAARAEQSASARSRALDAYIGKIKGKIRGNIVLPPSLTGNPEAIFEIVQLPTGDILSTRLLKSSGQPALDLAIERALRKSSPLPLPEPRELFERVIELKYRPAD